MGLPTALHSTLEKTLMKKTLIALAAVAAASSAMAQATISGTFGLGYGNSVTGEAAVASQGQLWPL